jgi:hypothetical protein
MNEIAADHARGGELLTADALRAPAARIGYDASPRDVVRLPPDLGLPKAGDVAAWRLGSDAAKALREQERLGAEPISDPVLAQLAGVQRRVLEEAIGGPKISYALDNGVATSRVVLRSKWKTGRRFDLARLLSDRVVAPTVGKLFPATRSYTYRQKMQRSFAAELLSPFEATDAMLEGDYSLENQQEVADHFKVSELTIRTLLVNHHRLERDELEEEFDTASTTSAAA